MKKKTMKIQKLNRILTKYKLQIVIAILFVLGLYHLLMCLVKANAFNINEGEISSVQFLLIRFYHFSCMMLIGIGASFNWPKKINWIWLYLGFRITYTFSRLIPTVDDIFSKTLMDGLSFGIIIIVILLILRHEKKDT